MREEVYEEIRSILGKFLESARLAASVNDKDYNKLAGSTLETDKETARSYIKFGQQHYLAALNFEGLNNVQYTNLKKEVHNGWIVHNIDTTPKTIEQTLQMYNKYKEKGRPYLMHIKNGEGVAYVQQGSVQANKPNNSTTILERGGVVLKCVHCGENHPIWDCPEIDDANKRR